MISPDCESYMFTVPFLEAPTKGPRENATSKSPGHGVLSKYLQARLLPDIPYADCMII